MIVLISICICAALPCVLSQVTLVESGPGVLRPSESLRMRCTISGVSITSSSYLWDWIRQPPGKGLEWLAEIYYDDRKWYAPALQNRLSISKDDSKNEYYLQMNNMKADDTAVYYCVRRSSTGAFGFDYWGQGTMVTVTSEPISAPTVFPLIPYCGSLPSQGQITIGCLATGYMPDPVEVTWNSGAITAGIKTPPSVSIAGRYMRSSQLTVPVAEAINGSYLCSIAHQYTGLKQNKAVTVLPCSPPLVKVLVSPPCDVPLSNVRAPSEVNATMEVVCLISDFYPGYLRVKWLANGKPTTSPASAPAPVRGTDGRFAASSQLTVRKGEWNQGTTYTCQVTHPTTGPDSLLNISKCAETCPSHMGVYLIPPSFEDLYLKKAAHVTCLITNMKTTESFEVMWAREKGVKLEVVTEDPQLHDNGTSSVVSRLAICVEDWQSGEKYTCTLKHPDLPSPLKVSIIRRKESSPRAPAVYLLPPHLEELSLQEQVSIICHVKGFNPKDIFVKWLHKGNEVSAGSYTTTDPMPSLAGGSYYLYSTMLVEAAEWNKGDSYSCVVGHEDLPYSMVQKSIDKFTGKPSSVSVSLVMSDSTSTCH